jgi:uncharacterized RDD family membrane protein YckC
MTRVATLVIRTPEGIVFSQLLAGPLTRFAAWLIDWMCITCLAIILNFLLVLPALLSPDVGRAMTILSYFAISIGYGIALEWFWRGQTLGKRILRLRVVDANGLRLQFSQVVIRNLLRAVDMLPLLYLVGGVACALTKRAQRLGDLAANTVVIRNPVAVEPDLDQLLPDKYNSFRDYPHLEVRLRQQVSAAEAALAVRALMRRDMLEPPARIQLFREIADHFRAKADFPAEATDGITDEQYVRNVVDVLYRTRAAGGVNKRSSQTSATAA